MSAPSQRTLPVGHARHQLAGAEGERVGHRLARQRQRVPSVRPAVEPAARLLARVCGTRAGGGGDVPALRLGGVDRERPAVAEVAPGVGRLEAHAAVVAPGRAVSRRLVDDAAGAGMPGEVVHVELRAGAVVGERRAAVVGAHHAAELDAHQQPLRAVRIGRDPADVVRPGPRREAPALARGNVLEGLELLPARAVARDEQPARLGAGVQRAVRGADGHREDVLLRQVHALPRGAGVAAEPRAVPLRADQHASAVDRHRVGGDAVEHGGRPPRPAVAVEPHDPLAGADEHGRSLLWRAVDNASIAEQLDAFAALLELADSNPYTVRAYRRAGETIRATPAPVAELVRKGASGDCAASARASRHGCASWSRPARSRSWPSWSARSRPGSSGWAATSG